MANCCNPIPGDEVFGFLTVSEGIKVHKKNCPNALSLQSNYAYRIIHAKWIDSSQQEFMHVNMKSLNFESDDGVFSGHISAIVKNNTMINKLIEKLKKINGIDKVKRV